MQPTCLGRLPHMQERAGGWRPSTVRYTNLLVLIFARTHAHTHIYMYLVCHSINSTCRYSAITLESWTCHLARLGIAPAAHVCMLPQSATHTEREQ